MPSANDHYVILCFSVKENTAKGRDKRHSLRCSCYGSSSCCGRRQRRCGAVQPRSLAIASQSQQAEHHFVMQIKSEWSALLFFFFLSESEKILTRTSFCSFALPHNPSVAEGISITLVLLPLLLIYLYCGVFRAAKNFANTSLCLHQHQRCNKLISRERNGPSRRR